MINKVRKTVLRNNMFESGDSVVVALSGGADSVSLLHVLISLSKELDLKVYAAHLNHNIRGEEALRDENFCRDLCEKLNVRLYVKGVDIPSLSRERGESEELCGRNCRYEFLGEVARDINGKIATAHTLSDSEETMLYNISRGSGLHGLISIPYKRQNIVRPLLDVSREEVEAYIAENNLSYVEDSTNFSLDACKRNRIRHSVLPPLKDLNEGFHENFSRLRSMLISTDNFMESTALSALNCAKCEFGLKGEELKKLHEAVLMRAICLWLDENGALYEYKHIEFISKMLESSGAVVLPKGRAVTYSHGLLRICEKPIDSVFSEIPFVSDCVIHYNGKEYSFTENKFDFEINKKLANCALDCDKIPHDAVLRTRREGDTFSPLYRNVTKQLRKLQNELSIPTDLRDVSLLVASGNKVLWAEHIGVSQDVSVSKSTKRAVIPSVRKGV